MTLRVVVAEDAFLVREGLVRLLEDGDDIEVVAAVGLGYLLKERVGDRDELIRALRTTAAGGSVVDPLVVEHLLARERRARTSPLAQLTEREQAVLGLMAQGHTNPAIANSLFVSESAVSKHIASIFTKLGLQEHRAVDRRVRAVITYLADRAQQP